MRKILSAIGIFLFSCSAASALSDTNIPLKFPIPWGASAGTNYINTIPIPSQIGIKNCAASLTDGFPPLTFVPAAAGGCPPLGQDFNGILNQLSAWSRWQAAGVMAPYDASFSSSIGGYPNGAVVPSATTSSLWWQSTVDNNASNPDTGGSNWSGVGYVPTGAMFAFGGAAAPPGFILCQGQSEPTASYPALFAVIGYTYGGSGANFTLPDLRGRTIYGPDGGAGRITSAGGNFNATLGASGGQQNQILTQAQLPPIAPTWNPTTQTWSLNQGGIPYNASTQLANPGANSPFSYTVTNSYTTPTVTVTPNGSIGGFSGLLGQSHPVLSPGQIANYIIKY